LTAKLKEVQLSSLVREEPGQILVLHFNNRGRVFHNPGFWYCVDSIE
jgi:hypothetical protein